MIIRGERPLVKQRAETRKVVEQSKRKDSKEEEEEELFKTVKMDVWNP